MIKSREKLNAYIKQYLKDRYHRRKQEAIWRLGSCCTRCGSIENLEVDHIDRTQKMMSFSRMYAVSQKRFDEELKKCQLLCRLCHQTKSIEEREFNDRSQHGTLVCYQRARCRCDLCRAENAAHNRKYKKRKREKVLGQ